MPPTCTLASSTLSAVHASDRTSGGPPHGVYQSSRPGIVSNASIRVRPVGPSRSRCAPSVPTTRPPGASTAHRSPGRLTDLVPAGVAVPEQAVVADDQRVAEHADRTVRGRAGTRVHESCRGGDPQVHGVRPVRAPRGAARPSLSTAGSERLEDVHPDLRDPTCRARSAPPGPPARRSGPRARGRTRSGVPRIATRSNRSSSTSSSSPPSRRSSSARAAPAGARRGRGARGRVGRRASTRRTRSARGSRPRRRRGPHRWRRSRSSPATRARSSAARRRAGRRAAPAAWWSAGSRAC